MAFERFVALWKHRYKKYSHITTAHWKARTLLTHLHEIKQKIGADRQLIGIVRTEHFGDIVAAEPIVRSLKEKYPNAYIVWFVKPVFRELVDVNPYIDEVVAEFCVTQRRLIKEAAIFDRFYELQFRNNNHCATCQVYTENEVAQAKGITVENYFDWGNLLEVFCASSGLPVPEDDRPKVYIQSAHTEKVNQLQLPERYIAIHCQSNYAPKDWPTEHWHTLIDWLFETYGYHVVEIGLSSRLKINNPRYRNATGKLSLLESAEVIRRATFFIGLDSGPTHFANAVGTKGFVLMGALNNFIDYNPYSGDYQNGNNCFIIKEAGKPCSQLSVEKVKSVMRHVIPSEIKH